MFKIKTILSFLFSFFLTYHLLSQGLGINDNGLAADVSAIIDVNADDMGLLIPRMTTSERNAIIKPAQALIIYNITNKCYEYWEYNTWQTLACSFTCGASSITFIYKGNSETYGTVVNPATGRCWLDKNLGATQVATSSNHSDAYGDLFQWGRLDDGHQDRNSCTYSQLSNTDIPGHNCFITGASSPPQDWRSPQNSSLWQGVNGINNPCPPGWRIPTQTEFNAERLSWQSNDSNGAFSSPLKLTLAGFKTGGASFIGSEARYWTSTISANGIYSQYLGFSSSSASIADDNRADGLTVRCIMD